LSVYLTPEDFPEACCIFKLNENYILFIYKRGYTNSGRDSKINYRVDYPADPDTVIAEFTLTGRKVAVAARILNCFFTGYFEPGDISLK